MTVVLGIFVQGFGQAIHWVSWIYAGPTRSRTHQFMYVSCLLSYIAELRVCSQIHLQISKMSAHKFNWSSTDSLSTSRMEAFDSTDAQRRLVPVWSLPGPNLLLSANLVERQYNTMAKSAGCDNQSMQKQDRISCIASSRDEWWWQFGLRNNSGNRTNHSRNTPQPFWASWDK